MEIYKPIPYREGNKIIKDLYYEIGETKSRGWKYKQFYVDYIDKRGKFIKFPLRVEWINAPFS